MKQFKNILYVSEGSESPDPALARAVTLAENNQAILTVVDVLPPVPASVGTLRSGSSYADLQAELVDQRRSELESLVAPFRPRLGIRVDVLVGKRFLELTRAVLRDDHDLLIKPVRSPSIIGRLFGSDDMHLLRKCPCPLWLTGPAEKANYSCIVAAVDFELEAPKPADQSLNLQIIELSASLAVSDFAALHLVHVWDAPAEIMVRSWSSNPNEAGSAYTEGEHRRHQAAFDQLRTQLEAVIGTEAYEHLAPQFHLHRGSAAGVIPELATKLQADLVVMGTVARTGVAGLLIGNTAETILEQLQCSVLAVKPQGFVTPVTLGG
jgi:universal stress protein E